MKSKMMKCIVQHKQSVWEFVKFNIVGVANTLVDIGVFAVFHTLFGVYYMIAQVISYSCGVLNSFLLNKHWTFRQKTAVNSMLIIKFMLVNIISLGMALFLLYIFKDRLEIDTMVSKLISTLFAMVVNFSGNKLWVFKEA